MPAIDFTSNVIEFNGALAKYAATFRLNRAEAIERVSGRLVDKLMRFTPPPRQSKGQSAVARDVKRAIMPLMPKKFRDKRIRKAIRERDTRALQAIFDALARNPKKKSPLSRGARVERYSPAFHKGARDYRGRVRKWTGLVTPDADQVREHIRKVRERVGWARGGWAASAEGLKRRVAGWVYKHRAAGRFANTLLKPNEENPGVEMTSLTAWASQERQRIESDAMKGVSKELLAEIASAEQKAQRGAFAFGRSGAERLTSLLR